MTEQIKKQSTLYSRILSLVFIPSAFLIFAFILIQLSSEIKTITTENKTKAQIASYLIRSKLESFSTETLTRTEIEAKIKEFSKTLIENELVDIVALISLDGRKLFSVPESYQAKAEDLNRIHLLTATAEVENRWLYQYPSKYSIDVYFPVRQDSGTVYFLKTNFPIGNLREALQRMYVSLGITALIVLSLAIFMTRNLSRRIVRPLNELSKATQDIMNGDFSKIVTIHTGDEIETLADTFNQMTRSLTQMKEVAENANALTHLPGNNAIQAEINKRIQARSKFVVIYGDLDNFKAYNDAYGIEKGDQVIKFTANLLKEAVKEMGAANDFVGHEGGDDFVMVTTPNRAQQIADYIIEQFAAQAKNFYSREDQGKGYVMGRERRQPGFSEEPKMVPFSFISISLAAISNESQDFASYADVTNNLVDIKHNAKNKKGNSFIWKR